MKRSEINRLMKTAIAFLEEQSFKLPPFAYWSPSDWRQRGNDANEIRECMLGWDLTDFGSGAFAGVGLIMFTIRNGHNTNPEYSAKPYCEKILIAGDGQVTPMHFHWNKMEDIINRGGGDLAIRLYNSTEDGELSQDDVEVSIDGVLTGVKAGEIVRLKPGESICLPPGLYHEFWGQGTVLIGEVSKVNDDNVDNRFYEEIGRFPEIEEDEEPLYLLFSEYPPAAE
ncbi:MAG: D-lyxose/D-mannose family sugar isomerase [Armatimonadota bacterium]|nr:D-lyxose/D-mannose family sugar isomerase [Armatimonadota bacterium]